MNNPAPRHFFDTGFATEEEWEIFRWHHASPLGGPPLEDVPFLMSELRNDASRKNHAATTVNDSDLVPSQFFGLNDWIKANDFPKNLGK